MSGGSYDYAYGRISCLADDVARNTRGLQESSGLSIRHPETQEWLTGEKAKELLAPTFQARLWLSKLLELVSEAMHDIEWVDSCDYGPGDELESIQKVAEFMEKFSIASRKKEPLIVAMSIHSSEVGEVVAPPGYEPLSVHVDQGNADCLTVFFKKT